MSEPKGPTQAAATPRGDEGTAPAGTRMRTFGNLLIAGVLAYQIGMPLTYYLSDRVYDERFSWRMFSTVRLQECEIQINETVAFESGRQQRPVLVGKDLQSAWVGVLKRMRPGVIEKYLSRRCDARDVEQVSLLGRCEGTDGTRLPDQHFVMKCQGRAFSQEGAP